MEEKVNQDPFVELTFESGRKLAGKLCGVVGPISAWSNPFVTEGPTA